MPILGIIASQGRVSTSYQSIATVTVGSGGQASATFTSIPQTFAHLQIRVLGRTSRANALDGYKLEYNSDTSSSYRAHYVYSTGSSSLLNGAEASSSAGNVYQVAGNSAPANVFGAAIIDIIDYANTNKNTTVRYLSGVDNNNSGEVFIGSHGFFKTNAITSIKIESVNGATLSEYSSFALYGIKGA